jgi:uncharacterized membrane protein (DUF4010 family)
MLETVADPWTVMFTSIEVISAVGFLKMHLADPWTLVAYGIGVESLVRSEATTATAAQHVPKGLLDWPMFAPVHVWLLHQYLIGS